MADVDLTELAIILQDTLGRIDNTIIVTAPPADDLGSIGAVAIDLDNNLIYGPKTVAGWGVGRPTIGGQGPEGPEGPEGPKGEQGDLGPKGDKGDQGDVGPKGDTGDTGPKGDKGDTGDTGPKGDKGDRGEAFAVNAQGSLAGRSDYDGEPVGFSYLDVDNGNLYFRVAPSGWSGAVPFGKGDKGDQGDEGPEGPQGPAGADGADGAPGADGSDATVVFATVAEVWAGTVTNKIIPPSVLNAAMAPQALTISTGTVSPDCNAGINFDIASINANITIANLANKTGKGGRSGSITGKNDATAGRTVSLGTDWKKIGTTAFPTTANAMWKMVYNIDSNGVNYSVMVLSA